MSKMKFCPYCGKALQEETEMRFCPFCGKSFEDSPKETTENPLEGNNNNAGDADQALTVSANGTNWNDETPQDSAENEATSYVPNKAQKAAAILYILGAVLSFLAPILYTIATVLLYRKANNKATKRGVLIAAGAVIFGGLAALIAQLSVGHEIIGNAHDMMMFSSPWMVSATFILGFGLVYAAAIIVRNNDLDKRLRTWLNVLAACASLNVFSGIMMVTNYSVYPYAEEQSFAAPVFSIFVGIMQLCALWVIARSELFAGNYDAQKVCNYSIKNKYMAICVIVPIILYVVLAILGSII